MELAAFKSGVHPYEGKGLSASGPTEILTPKGKLVYLLSQHIGAPMRPLMKKGDQVLVGQTVGEAYGFVSANVICSVSGTVKVVEPRRVTNGSMTESIVAENNGGYKAVEKMGMNRNPFSLSKQEIYGVIKGTGIVGLGDAGFPAHIRSTPKEDDKIKYVIVSSTECKPYLTSDYRLMLEQPKKIISGLNIILNLFGKAWGVISIEDNKPGTIARMTEPVRNESRTKVVSLRTKCPRNGERALIYAVTGGKINSTMLPADVGCTVDNVGTVFTIYMTICYRTPLLRGIFTMTGDTVASPSNPEICTGTCRQELMDAADGFKTEPEKIIFGDPMMGRVLFDSNIPVTKTSSALTYMTKDEVAAQEPMVYIRYGRCAEICPGHIIPQKLMQPTLDDDLETFEKLRGMECCGYGCCALIHPARRQLTRAFKEAKLTMRATRKKAQEGGE